MLTTAPTGQSESHMTFVMLRIHDGISYNGIFEQSYRSIMQRGISIHLFLCMYMAAVRKKWFPPTNFWSGEILHVI